jgi:hypothetical protein
VKKKIFVRAPCLSQSGYGEQARFALRALKSREDLFEIYLQPIPWGQTGWVWQDSEFRQWMDSRIIQTQILLQQQQLQPDMSLQVTIPNEFDRLCPVNIGYTAGIETDRVAPVWLQKGNEAVDKILVVSNHAKETYTSTKAKAVNRETNEEVDYKLETPVEVVFENTPRSEPEEIPGFELTQDFNFLVCSQISPRKNFENTIAWWVEEFQNDDVGLIIKTNMKGNSIMDLEVTERSLKGLLAAYPDRKCKVSLLHGDLTSGQMTSLYIHPKVKAIVNIAHGEGFGLPLYEAAREGMPVVTIGWSGQMDFLHHNGKDYFNKVSFTMAPVQQQAQWEGVIEKTAMWAHAEEGSYKMTIRDVYNDWDKAKEMASELQTIVNDEFSDEKLFKLFVDSVLGFDSSLIESEEEVVLEFD